MQSYDFAKAPAGLACDLLYKNKNIVSGKKTVRTANAILAKKEENKWMLLTERF